MTVPNDLLALLIVLLIPVAAAALVAGLVLWARDSVRRSRVIGGFGVVCVAVALVNLYVARACSDGVNRPIVGMWVSDHGCQRVGVMSFEAVLLAIVATSVVVRLADVRR